MFLYSNYGQTYRGERLTSELENLAFIDLLSERHIQLRSISEKLWNATSDIYISNSEWFIMARIYKKQPTISYVSKHVDISRQATHKFIKSLEQKRLVEIKQVENNKKDKCLLLTKLGEECYEKNMKLTADLENKVSKRLGTENMAILKDLLKSDWGLTED